MTEQKVSQQRGRDPEKLSTEYHKARKEVLLWAGILFVWELIGIDLEKAKEAGGNAGAIINAIKSPQAVPWVLLVLVGYFLFKLWIEWNQCAEGRRRSLHSRIDFGSAWVVAFVAGVLYAYQAISRVQVADTLRQSFKGQSLLMGLATALMGVMLAVQWKRFTYPSKLFRVAIATMVLMPLLMIAVLAARGLLNVKFLAGGVAAGAAVGVVLFIMLNKLVGRQFSSSSS